MGDMIQNNIFLVIPSLQKMLDYPTTGRYIDNDQIVTKILSDPIIFFGGLEATKQVEDHFLHFIFGVGYYYVKFELENGGRYILDNRFISGLALSDFVYDKLITAKSTAFQNLYDVVANDFIYKIPINLSDKTATQRIFIDGTLMRQIFIPFKEVIMEMMKKIQSDEKLPVHSLLCATYDEFDQILLGVRLNPESMKNYLKPIPGIIRIDYGAEQLLHKAFSTDEIGVILKIVQNLEKTYSTLAFNPIQLNTLLENASFALESNFPNPRTPPEKPSKRKKASILLTAAENEKITSWPKSIPSLETLNLNIDKYGLPSKVPPISNKPYEGPEYANVDVKNYKLGGSTQEEQYELREFSHQKPSLKPLPTIPTRNIVEILEIIREIINEDYGILDIGKSLAIARDNIRKITLHTEFLFEMGKYANIYSKSEPNIAFNHKEKGRFLEIVDEWIKMAKITMHPKTEK